MTRQSLVNGIVHNFVNQVVEALDSNIANVHGRPFANGFEALKDLDIFGRVLSVGG
jgi:hypothetical protein